MRFIFILVSFVFAACQTNRRPTNSLENTFDPLKADSQQHQPSEKIEMTQTEVLALSRRFLNEDEPEKALEALGTINAENRTNPEYIKLKRDALQKSVLNLRYKARVLYEKSTQQSGKIKRNLLKECKRILEAIIKNHPEYEDMYAVKSNLKQIDQELRA